MTLTHFDIPQLIIHRSASGPVIVARSEGLSFEREEFALKTAVAVGVKPEGITCPQAVMAWPFDADTVAVVTMAEAGFEAFAFRFLFVNRIVYRVLSDPFLIADHFPVNVATRGSLPMLTWLDEPPPMRKVLDLQAVLKAGDSAFLLGAAQSLIDGVSIRVQRSQPDPLLIRNLWQFLPSAARKDLYPAEYCFSETLAFHIAVLPSVPGKLLPGQLNEDQVKYYPEGRFELAMQVAIEDGDQRALDKLLARRTSREVFRLAVGIVIFAFALMFVAKFIR